MSRVLYQVSSEGIATVTLNRADKLNALDMKMFKAISKVIKNIKQDKRVRVVILKGAGDDFCSGLDVKSVITKPTSAIRLLFKWLPHWPNLAQRVSCDWRKLNVPVICVIHGRCWGGGMQIALGADFRIAEPNASLSIMESKWGLIPDMAGNKPLSELMPIDVAKKLVMTAEVFDGEQAQQYNLVTEVHESAESRAIELANQLLNTSPDILQHSKQLFNRRWHKPMPWFLMSETWRQIKIIAGKNQRIAVKRAQGKDIPFK